MASQFSNILSSSEISFLQNHPDVLLAKEKLQTQNIVYFHLPIPSSIKNRIQENMGVHLTSVNHIPMRWIKGDTIPHIDRCVESFQNTYLMYLNNSSGSLIVDQNIYPISEGTGYVFNEGLHHETIGTGNEPRLLIGPMSENGLTVGTYETIIYYSTKNSALTRDPNKILAVKYYNNAPNDYLVGQISTGSLNGITRWRIASNSTGSSSQSIIYSNGNFLNDSIPGCQYFLYPIINTRPRNQQQAIRQSLNISPAWDAYKYYETNALKYGFSRISFKNYVKFYYRRR